MLRHSHRAAPPPGVVQLSPRSGKSLWAASWPTAARPGAWGEAGGEVLRGGVLVFQSLTFSRGDAAWGPPLPLPGLSRGPRTQARCQGEWARLKIWELPSPPARASPQRGARRRGSGPCGQEAPASSPGTVDRASGLRPEDAEAGRGPGTGLAPGIEAGSGAAPGQQEDGKVFCQSRPEGTRALQSAEGRGDHRRATDGCGSGCHFCRGLSQAPAYPAGSPVGQGEEHELGRSPSSASQLGHLRQASYPVHASASPSVKWDG